MTRLPQCCAGVCVRSTAYQQPTIGGNTRWRKSLKQMMVRFYGTSSGRQTNTLLTINQISPQLKRNTSGLVDVVIPGDSHITQKETEKLTIYQDLKIEVQKLWE